MSPQTINILAEVLSVLIAASGGVGILLLLDRTNAKMTETSATFVAFVAMVFSWVLVRILLWWYLFSLGGIGEWIRHISFP